MPQQESLLLTIIVPVLYIGSGSADIFILRSHALQFLGTVIVGAYHNLIPLCTIALAPSCWGNRSTHKPSWGLDRQAEDRTGKAKLHIQHISHMACQEPQNMVHIDKGKEQCRYRLKTREHQ